MPKYCCIYNHYNKNKTINKYVFRVLDFFSSLNCETIVVSNSPIESEDDKTLLFNRFKGQYFERENKGYDFAAWQYAINRNFIPDDTEYLFLVNDSIIGPLNDINIVLDKMMLESNIDFWGLTDSYQVSWHLQSYFLCFNRKIFTSEIFRNFFKQNFIALTKNELITNGEIQLSKILVDAGFKGRAYFEYDKFAKKQSNSSTFNPTHNYAANLITEYKFPFIKKELLLQNPENIDIPNGLFNMLERETSYPLENIKEVLISKYTEEVEKFSPPVYINVVCHIYYQSSVFGFLNKLCALKKYNCKFIFNLSTILYNDKHFVEILSSSFEGCLVLLCPNIGKDIGGKLALLDLCLKLNYTSDYYIFLHDKQSPHTTLGETWKNKLFRIIEPNTIDEIVNLFEHNKDIGIISAEEFIINEYDKKSNNFNCTSNLILKELIAKYSLKLKTHDFVGGTMFWIRAEIVNSFFKKHSPLDIRATLEKGNVLDHEKGSITHGWERMLSWIAIDQGYYIKGK